MKLTMEFDLPTEQHDYNRVFFAGDAWSAIDCALVQIRNHQKHGAGSADEVVDQVRETLTEAWRNVE